MSILPEPLERLILALERLPGVGPKTASRLAFFLLKAPAELSEDLADTLKMVKNGTAFCHTCFNITDAGREECAICADPNREKSVVCVVEDPLDMVALEKTAGFKGQYPQSKGLVRMISRSMN